METLMAAAACAEILLASIGLALMFAALALRGTFWLMRGTHREMKFARSASRDLVMKESARAGLVPARVSASGRGH